MKRGHRWGAGALILAALVIAGPLSALASAGGEPASDVLFGEDVFLPYSPISTTRSTSSTPSPARPARRAIR